jgi:pyoverdine/dityrosine biosynthesis protein Dit1
LVQDLDHHPKFKNQSASKRGDLANEVAKEMLRRNQAYSHLVELLHPRALRISIHQHKNHGPKFAINTLPNQKFRAIQSLGDIDSGVDGGRDSKVEEAHVPTPWHNVLIEVEGHAMTYIGKNGIALDEKANTNSRYICTIKDDGRGARWVLKERI